MKSPELTPEEISRAREIQDQVLYIDANSTTMYWVLGELCLEVQKKKLWKALDAPSFTQWLKTHLGKSRSTVMSAMRSVKTLSCLAAREDLHKIPRANAELLCKLTESQRAVWIEKAWLLAPQDFRKAVEATLTPLEVDEKKKRISLNPTLTQFAAYEDAWAKVAREVGAPVTREYAFEIMAAEYQPSILSAGQLENMYAEDNEPMASPREDDEEDGA